MDMEKYEVKEPAENAAVPPMEHFTGLSCDLWFELVMVRQSRCGVVAGAESQHGGGGH